MRKYKRVIGIILFIILFVALVGSIVACEKERYTISFVSNGGSPCEDITTSGKHSLSLPTPQKDGYTFDGWYFDDGQWQTPLERDTFSDKRLKEDITVYAKWSFSGYIVEFDENGGSSVENLVLEKDDKISSPPFTEKEGYQFLGWCVDSTLTTYYEFGSEVDKSMTLYAKWLSLDDLQHCYITFETNGGTEVERLRVMEGESFVPPTTTRQGYDFLGWFLDDDLTMAYPQGSIVTSDFTLYAKWSENTDLLTITFNTDGGNDIDPSKVMMSEVFPPPTPYKEGYIFIGWYTDEDLTQVYDFTKGAYASLTLYAKWEETAQETTYFTAFYYMGENMFSQVVLEEGTPIPNISGERAGYQFLGWYQNEELTEPFSFNYLIDEDTLLYGKWQEENAFNEGGMTFVLEEDESYYILSDFDNSYEEVTIPQTVNSLPVKTIGQEAFKNSYITKIIFSDSTEEIKTSAFEDCNRLTEVTINANINSISNRAFARCDNLKDVIFEGAPDIMGNYIFSDCVSLKNVIFHDDMQSIASYMFNNCLNLVSVNLPLSCQTIGQGAFTNCDKLANVSINDNCKTIQPQAFQNCFSLSEIDLANIEQIKSNAFYKSGLLTVELTDSVTTVGSSAFGECVRLEQIYIGEGLETLNNSFMSSLQVESFAVSENNTSFSSQENNLYNKDKTILYNYAPNQSGDFFEIPEGVQTIEVFAFTFAKNLTSLHISHTVENINPLALLEINLLTEITVDVSNTRFYSDEGVLYNNDLTQLIKYPMNKDSKSFVMPNTVEQISPYSFMGVKGLKEITLSQKLTEIADYSFYGLSSLERVNFNGAPLERIGEEAFYECISLINIALPSALSFIGQKAFYGSGLKSIVIPTEVEDMGDRAFANNQSLSKVTIGAGIVNLNSRQFQNSTNLSEVIILGSPQTIGNAFEDCQILTVSIHGDTVVETISSEAFSTVPLLKVQAVLQSEYQSMHGEKFSQIVEL